MALGLIRRPRTLFGVGLVLLLGAAGTAVAPAVQAMTGLGSAAEDVRPGPTLTGGHAGYRISTEVMPDGSVVILRWNPCQTITYKVNVAALPAQLRPVVLAEVRTAFERLATASGLRFGDRGTTMEVPRSTSLDQQSAEIIVAVTDPSETDFPIGGGTLGFAGRSWYWWRHDAGTGASYGAGITRGFVVLDAGDVPGVPAGFGHGLSRGNLILHELGHAVGLGHAGIRTSLMYPELSSTSPSGYSDADRSGLALVGRRSGCLVIPVRLPAPDLS